MPPDPLFRERRRSARVPLKVDIKVEAGSESFVCDGETIVVNMHGALISTVAALRVGMKISIHVFLTDKRASARVVCTNQENPLQCGIELERPQNIWGVFLPPEDWEESTAMGRF